MKSSVKRFLIIFLVLITFSCAMLFGACSCNEEEPVPPPPAEEVYGTEGFRFVTATNQLLVGEEYVAPVEFVYEEGVDVEYSSSDNAVATIDVTGKITAVKPGKTTILGVYGKAKDKFDLEVVTDGYLPTLEFEAGLQSANYVEKGASLNVKPVVYFNGKAFTDFTVEYKLSNSNYGSVNKETHTFTATTGDEIGKTTLTVTANWRDIESPFLTKEIDIEVVKEFSVVIDDGAVGSIEIYTFNLNDEITEFANINNRIKATYDGEPCTFSLDVLDNVAEIAEDGQAVIWDGTSIKAKNSGSAKLEVTVHTTDGDKPYYYDVICKKPVKVVESRIEYFETDIGEIHNFASYVPSGADGTIVRAYQDGRQLKVENNKLLDVSREIVNAVSVENVTVYTKDIEYRFTLDAYTRVIDEGSDLTGIWWSQDTLDGAPNDANKRAYLYAHPVLGYYFVKEDIKEATPYAVNPTRDLYTNLSSIFGGTFDGNGKVIEYSIAKNTNNGFFGEIGAGAVVKNASFVVKAVKNANANDDKITTDSAYALAYNILAQNHTGVKPIIKNVFVGYDVEFEPNGKAMNVGLAWNSIYASYENVVIDMSSVKGVKQMLESDTANEYTYSVFDYRYDSSTKLDNKNLPQNNVFVISDVPYLKYNFKDANKSVMYVASNDAAMLEGVTATQKDAWNTVRFANYTEAVNYFKASDENKEVLEIFGDYIDVSYGFPYAGNKENLVNRASVVKVNDVETDEIIFDLADTGVDATKTISLTYYDNAKQFNIQETDSLGIIEVSGTTVTYNTGVAGSAKLTITATIEGVNYQKEISVKVGGIDALTGTVYYDGEGETAFKLPTSITSLEGYAENKLTIVAADATTIIEDGQSKLATNLENKIKEYAGAYVYLDGVAKGTIYVNSVTKLITKASDLASLYIDTSDTGIVDAESTAKTEFDNTHDVSDYTATAEKNAQQLYDAAKQTYVNTQVTAYLTNNAVRGYFLVMNDITWDSVTDSNNHYATPVYDAHTGNASYFAGVLDGSGYTVEFGLKQSFDGTYNDVCGLIGSLYSGSEVKNISLIVKAIPTAKKNIAPILEVKGHSFSGMVRPKMTNVYMAYGDKLDIDLTASEVRLGFVKGDSGQVDMYNVVMDYGNIDCSSIATKYSFLGSQSARYDESNGTIKMHEGCSIITNAPYLYNDGTTTKTTFTENVTGGFTKYSNYSELGSATIEINKFIISSNGVAKKSS